MKRYKSVTVAGTFDHLHKGQKKLIDEAFKRSEKVAVGITTEKLLKNKFLKSQIQTFAVRKAQVGAYLKTKRLLHRARFFPLDDIYGIAKTSKELEAVLVTDFSHKNGLTVNKLRKDKGLPVLDLIEVELYKDAKGNVVSSERIRRGEIDREGKLYDSAFLPGSTLNLPKGLRGKLRKPLGEVIGKPDEFDLTAKLLTDKLKKKKPVLLVAVGDIVAAALRKIKITADIEVIDLHTKKEKIKVHRLKHENIITVNNYASTISYEVIPAYQKSVKKFLDLKKRTQIVINGEEDLVALPAVLLAPLGALVLYGQFDLGVVVVEVTESKKEEVRNIVEKFV